MILRSSASPHLAGVIAIPLLRQKDPIQAWIHATNKSSNATWRVAQPCLLCHGFSHDCLIEQFVGFDVKISTWQTNKHFAQHSTAQPCLGWGCTAWQLYCIFRWWDSEWRKRDAAGRVLGHCWATAGPLLVRLGCFRCSDSGHQRDPPLFFKADQYQ